MINLVVADDHKVLREALCAMLQSSGNYQVLGQAENGSELLKILQSKSPDIVIMDIEMPEIDGIQTLESMKAQRDQQPPVLILSANDGKKNIRNALRAGAKGFIPKDVDLTELQFAIQSILEGNTYISPSITTAFVGGAGDESDEDPLKVLTKREREILGHLADGMPNREIGKLLHISTRTVDTHRTNILKKLDAKTNAELVKIAISAGLIEV